ncbi:MAG: hypothetical protein U9R19_14190 [Bacteroidota bacterium]|nr:hypothetical protein [Bacteroidota bacterium]
MKAKTRFSILIISMSFLFFSCEEIATDDPRTIYIGMWDVVENSGIFGSQYYEAEIFATSSDESILSIANFFGLGTWIEIEAEINDDVLIIPFQTIEGYEIVGQGQISSNKKIIDFAFTVEEVATTKSTYSEEVTAVFTKQ